MNYCANGNLQSTFTFIGHIVAIAKIFIPIIIIGFGIMDLFKAITGSKDDEIKKSLSQYSLKVYPKIIKVENILEYILLGAMILSAKE